jgi:hypothetical protein
MEIPGEVLDLYYKTVDDFIDINFGLLCTLHYPETSIECLNCIYNPFTKSSSGQFKTGGPIPFQHGQCPYCYGKGMVNTRATENIKLRCYFDRKTFNKLASINIDSNGMLTYGHIADLAKVRRCDFITIPSGSRYTLSGEPVLHGIQKNKYFIAGWKVIV